MSPQPRKLYAVICLNLHYSAGPYSQLERAQAVANELNALSGAKEREDPNYAGCRYAPIGFFVMSVEVRGQPEVEKKSRPN